MLRLDEVTRLERHDSVQELIGLAAEHDAADTYERALARFLSDVMLEAGTVQQEAGEDDRELLTIITMHRSKGLEFKAVFLLGVQEGLVPHSRAISSLREVEEERRLLYVALTRAMRVACITYDQMSGPSRFLADIPSGLIKNLSPPAADTVSEGPLESLGSYHASTVAAPLDLEVEMEGLGEGMLVEHPDMGIARVVGTRPRMGDVEVELEFVSSGKVRRFMLSMAKLRRIVV